MTHRCVIISGGNYAPVEGVREDDFVIACDKGYVYAQQAGVTCSACSQPPSPQNGSFSSSCPPG